jgi:hypothetical protein
MKERTSGISTLREIYGEVLGKVPKPRIRKKILVVD